MPCRAWLQRVTQVRRRRPPCLPAGFRRWPWRTANPSPTLPVGGEGAGHFPPLAGGLRGGAGLLLLFLLLAAWLAGATPAVAQGPDNRVGLVVQFGNGAVFSQCYAYTDGM
ncbi:MAG: hypothetical protein KIS91_18255, partial [Anaerolineae bacterium]|nr:hypothetical protein [Anaerolineae bacterium]